MRLWIDGQCFQTPSRMRGIGRYVQEFTQAIARHQPDIELLISFNAGLGESAILARDMARDWIDYRNIHVWHGTPTEGEAESGHTMLRDVSETALVHHVNCLAPDVALSASPFEGLNDPAVPLLPSAFCTVPIASVFYDVIPLRFEKKYLDKPSMRAAYVRRLDRYKDFDLGLCISEFSQRELGEVCPTLATTNISAGVSDRFLQEFARVEQSTFRKRHGDYILYVGGLDWRKNVETAIKAFRLLPAQLRETQKFLVAGDYPACNQEELVASWRQKGLHPTNLVCLNHVSESELVDLYIGARLLIQPSFMEGFGLTALEAMTCGTPVVAANTGALPEVVGSSDLLFDPHRPQDLARSIERQLTDPQFSKQAARDAKVKAASFSWQQSASIAADALRRLAKPSTQRPTLGDLRGRARAQLKHDNSSHDKTAKCLALAEPLPTGEPRLIIDATATILADHKTGIQRVVRNICRNVGDGTGEGPPRTVMAFCTDDSGWHDTQNSFDFRADENDGQRLQILPSDRVLMLDSSWELYHLHGRYLRGFRIRGLETVSCLYDTVPLRTPAFCDPGMPIIFSKWFRSALAHSTGFVCISRAVADELLAMLKAIGFPRRMQIGHWPLGADFAVDPKQSTPPISPKRRMFLMVGTLEPRKGHSVALDAFERVWASGTDVDLVMVGKLGWGVEELAKRIRSHAEYGVRLFWHERVEDDQLTALYADCSALVAASYAEGFGLPIVEAGHFGKPVLASDIPVFREVANGAAFASFFNVGCAQSLTSAVRSFVTDVQTPDTPHARSSWPTWSESARRLKEVVCSGVWYEVYEPETEREYVPLHNLGRTHMDRALSLTERGHSLRYIDGPTIVDGGRNLRITVTVQNKSDFVWSSEGAGDGTLGIALSYHVLDQNGMMLNHDNPRSRIPFVLIPGDTHYMAVTMPTEWRRRGAKYVDLELVQEGVAWFGDPLRVSI